MKIGIVTYHRSHNYGALLQAIALRKVIADMGHDVTFVDYWPDYHREMYKLFSYKRFLKFGLVKKIRYISSLCFFYRSKKRRISNFNEFFREYIYPYCRPVDECYDVVIYGSDQIWRKQKALGTYNPFYFGNNNIKTKKHVSYAASMGNPPKNTGDLIQVRNLVSHLNKISVREENLKDLLISLEFKDVALSLDPTLLLNSEKWNQYLPTESFASKRYALLYILDSNPFDMKEIYRFVEYKGLTLKILHGYATTKESEDNITTAGPLEFIQLIKNADYVFSASFHGLVFSIIYGKQFFTSFHTNSARAESLLRLLGIKGRLLSPKSVVPHDIKQIDYDNVYEQIDIAKTQSLNYLIDSVA